MGVYIACVRVFSCFMCGPLFKAQQNVSPTALALIMPMIIKTLLSIIFLAVFNRQEISRQKMSLNNTTFVLIYKTFFTLLFVLSYKIFF